MTQEVVLDVIYTSGCPNKRESCQSVKLTLLLYTLNAYIVYVVVCTVWNQSQVHAYLSKLVV